MPQEDFPDIEKEIRREGKMRPRLQVHPQALAAAFGMNVPNVINIFGLDRIAVLVAFPQRATVEPVREQ